MDFKAFLTAMAELLEVEENDLKDDFELNSDNYDSVVVVSTIGLIDEYFDVLVRGTELAKVSSIGELLSLIKKTKEESQCNKKN